MTARLMQVVFCDELRRGEGTKRDPVRRVTQYYSTDGDCLAEVDPCAYGPELEKAARSLLEVVERGHNNGGSIDGYVTHLRRVLDRAE